MQRLLQHARAARIKPTTDGNRWTSKRLNGRQAVAAIGPMEGSAASSAEARCE